MKPISFYLTALILLLAGSASAQISRFSYERYISNTGDTLNYRFLSTDYDTLRRYPLVVFLHGSGESGNDNESQLKWGVMNFATDQAMVMHPAFVIAPQCQDGMEWENINEDTIKHTLTLLPSPSKPMKLLIMLIHEIVRNYAVDSNRIYITGISMGGFGTFDAIERYPDLFAAAVPVCGGGDISKATLISHVPIWIFHGAEDPGVDPIYSFRMAEALMKAGAHPGYTQYPETGHFSWLAVYSDQQMFEWMFRQRRQ